MPVIELIEDVQLSPDVSRCPDLMKIATSVCCLKGLFINRLRVDCALTWMVRSITGIWTSADTWRHLIVDALKIEGVYIHFRCDGSGRVGRFDGTVVFQFERLAELDIWLSSPRVIEYNAQGDAVFDRASISQTPVVSG